MPSVFNITPPIRDLNINVRSVRCFLWASTEDKTAEVAPAAAHYVEFEGFPQNNANGTSLGFGSIDSGLVALMDRFTAADVPSLLQAAFN